MIHYDAPHLTIRWDQGTNCVHIEWKGFIHGEIVRDGLHRALAFFKQKNTDRWLGDTRKLKVMIEEDMKWINDVWFPQAFSAGLRKLAYVIPESALAQMSLKRLMSKVKDETCEIAYFSDLEEAKRWLRAG